MSFFQELTNTKPYFKAAFEGFAGSGKTYTASQIAIGIHQRVGSKKPVILFDTERAAKFLKPMFASAGVKVLLKESRSLTDLCEAMRLCKDGESDILIIDSISHIWEGFLQTHLEKTKRSRMEFQDWGIVKPAWKRLFSDPFVNDPYHCIICGRAGYDYTDEKNPETGRREIFKSGIKMKVEGETAYEPDVLVLMERFEKVLGDDKEVWREGTVLKDRSTLTDGKTFRNPTYQDFSPAIEAMLSDPDYKVPTSSDDSRLTRTEEEKQDDRREREILREEIQGMIVQAFPGQTSIEKKMKVDALEQCLGTRSWSAVETMRREELLMGLDKLKMWLEEKKAEAAQ